MYRSSQLFGVIALAAIALMLPSPVRSAGLDYHIDVVREDPPVVDVEARLSRYTGGALRMILATPPVDAETYFRFFDSVAFHDGTGAPLAADRAAPGIYRLAEVTGEVRVTFRVHLGELNRAVGDGHRLPAIDAAGAVLPLRALLPVPESIDGGEIALGDLAITVTDGDRPLVTPWETSGGRVAFGPRDAGEIVRTGIVVTGETRVHGAPTPAGGPYVVVRHGDAADAERAAEIASTIAKHYATRFGYAGLRPLTIVWDIGEGEPDAVASGPFLRVRCPATFLRATPAELTYGSEAYDFYRVLAHETFHHWIGAGAIARPAGPELFWMSEGAAEYLGMIALVHTGFAEPPTVLDALADRVARVRAHPERTRAIDGSADIYAASAGYREILLIEAPLVCFLLDTRLVEEDPAKGLEVIAQRLLIAALMHVSAPVFDRDDVEAKLESLLGLEGRLAVTTYVSGSIDAALAPRARAVGISWRERSDGPPILSLEPGSAFARRLEPAEGAP